MLLSCVLPTMFKTKFKVNEMAGSFVFMSVTHAVFICPEKTDYCTPDESLR